ncbi:hypothetical protein Tco_1068462 [Tanacetum coccineum]|uniref:Uncharacterized protein n=1 Tax=Tanacetum coccineum TaxID=301880 RepID=A0ABQ5HHQ0_9ASTR
MPKIEKFVKDQLEAKVLTRLSNQANTSQVVAANLSELELKKILIDKMENNKSIDKSIQQKTLYNALVDAYETDKDILETYGDTVNFKRSRKMTRIKMKNPLRWINQDFSAFVMNRLKVDTLTPELLAGPTYELMKGSCKSLVELEYFLEEVYKATTNQLDWNNPEDSKYPHIFASPLTFDSLIHEIMDTSNRLKTSSQTRCGVICRVSTTNMHYGASFTGGENVNNSMDLLNNEKLYTFKEGDYNRLRLQDIEDMLLFLVQGKLTNLNVEEHLALGVSL